MNTNLNITNDDAAAVFAILSADPRVKESSVKVCTLGQNSLSVKVYFNSKDECANGILMNGAHRFIMLHHDGSMVNLTGYKTAKFRQGTVKSVDEFKEKLRKWLVKSLEVQA